MSIYVTARELTQPLALPPKESPLLRSRKRIINMKNNHNQTINNNKAKHPKVNRSNIDGCTDEPMLEQNFVTTRSKVRLDCKPDKMNLSLNFTEPFRGLISIGQQPTKVRQREPWCSVRGDGSLNYVLRLPLNKCLTRFDVSLIKVMMVASPILS